MSEGVAAHANCRHVQDVIIITWYVIVRVIEWCSVVAHSPRLHYNTIVRKEMRFDVQAAKIMRLPAYRAFTGAVESCRQ